MNTKQLFTIGLLLVGVNANAQFTSFATSNSPVCTGSDILLSCQGSTSDTYSWTGPAGFSSNLQNPDIPNASFLDSGVYRVIKNGIDTYYTGEVFVYPSVSLNSVTASQTITAGNPVQLNAQGATYWIWTPSDKSLSNPFINNPVATPAATTTYKVVGMNTWGCRDSALVTITVNFPVSGTVLIPAAFTPNNDGLNDYFRVVNPNGFELQDFSVFNKWGQLIYHNSTDIRKGWDGTFNGIPQDIGVYNYRIVLEAPDGEKKIFNGNVTLIR